jgi:hypothetical protein
MPVSAGNPGLGTRSRRVVRKTVLLLVMGMILGSCSSGVSPPSASPGELSGVVIGHSSQEGHRAPLANAPVGVYRQAVSSGGPVLQNPPKPVATTTTNSAGVFTFQGLPAGKWFVLALNQAGQGTWVRFDPATGAVVTLVVCTDCPMPL